MKIATLSLDVIWQDINANLNRITTLVQQAKADGCDTVVLPEVCTTGFLCDMRLIEPEYGNSYHALQALAKKNHINIIAGISEQPETGKAKNVALGFNKNGEAVAHFSKLHPFSYAKEQETFQAGDKTVVFELDGVPCSIFICYDLRFPEVFRQVAKQVEIIFVIANWPDARIKHWKMLLKARAIENICYVVGVNRIGKDGVHLRYSGYSMVINPLGKVVLRTDKTIEYANVDCDTSEVARIRKKYPFLNDIRFLNG